MPAGAFPVAARAGRIDKASFVRLAGDGAELALGLVEDRGANQLMPLAGVRACPIVEGGWELGEAASPRNVPDHDDGRCTPGTQDADGRWVFDLSPLGDLHNNAVSPCSRSSRVSQRSNSCSHRVEAATSPRHGRREARRRASRKIRRSAVRSTVECVADLRCRYPAHACRGS